MRCPAGSGNTNGPEGTGLSDEQKKELVIAKTPKAPNFTEQQEQDLRNAAISGPLNLARATTIAADMGKTPRSVIAKIVRMGLPYESKQPVTKNGEPIVSKADLVAMIGKVVEGNLDGLEKAPKAALFAIAAHVA